MRACVIKFFTVEQTKNGIQVLSQLSTNLFHMANYIIDLHDDSDVEEMEISNEEVSLKDYLLLFNNADRCKRILHFFDDHKDDNEVLTGLTNLCHNLILIYKDSIRKFM